MSTAGTSGLLRYLLRLPTFSRIAVISCPRLLSFAEIGVRIGRDRSVVWREYRRNCLPNGDFHALMAHALATQKARRPKAFRLNDHRLCSTIQTWMDDGWSPRLISEMLARDHPDDKLLISPTCLRQIKRDLSQQDPNGRTTLTPPLNAVLT